MWLPGDFDHDGMDDLVWRDGDQTTISVFRANLGILFKEPKLFAIQDSPWEWHTRWTVGDFDNDGDAGIAAISNDEGFNTITLRLTTGTTLTQQQWATRKGAFDYASKWFAGDFTGDGLADLAEIRRDGSTRVARVYASTGSSLSDPIQWASFVNTVATPPVNGNFGTTLPVGTTLARAPATATVSMGTLTTGTLSSARQIATGPGTPTNPDIDVDTSADTTRWTAGDFDADGRADLASVWDDAGTSVITVLRSTGTSFTKTNWSNSAGAYAASTQWCAGRFRSPNGGGVVAQ